MTRERICPACARSYDVRHARCPHCFPPRPFLKLALASIRGQQRMFDEFRDLARKAGAKSVETPPGPRTRAEGNTSPLAPEKSGGELFTLTRGDLRALVDVVTNDHGVADTRLQCYLSTLTIDTLIDRMLSQIGKPKSTEDDDWEDSCGDPNCEICHPGPDTQS